MKTINVHEAKTNLSRLLAMVEGGEEIVIARGGKPVARLVPVDLPTDRRLPGLDKGRIEYADDMDAPLSSDVVADVEA